jgi:hypothetical protein
LISPPIFLRWRACCTSALFVFKRFGDDVVDRPETPIPSSSQANMPFTGPMKVEPRCLRISTFATVAGCIHIFPFIAGASSSGAFGSEYDGRQSVIGHLLAPLLLASSIGRAADPTEMDAQVMLVGYFLYCGTCYC